MLIVAFALVAAFAKCATRNASAAVTVSEQADLSSPSAGPTAMPQNGQINVPLSSGDGPKTLFVRLRDRAANDALASVQLTRDTSAPDTAGASLTVTLLDDELKALWDAPVHTAALRW